MEDWFVLNVKLHQDTETQVRLALNESRRSSVQTIAACMLRAPTYDFVWLNFMKPSRVERHGSVMNVDACSFELANFAVFGGCFDGSSFIVFNPDSTSIESSKSDSMVQFSDHVLHVAM